MKRKIVFALFVAGIALLFGIAFAGAESDNAALVVRLDEDCAWFDGDLVAEGSVHYAEAQNGQWTLSCKGEIIDGLPISRAVTVKSTDDAPVGDCFTPFGVTYNWHVTYTPSGKSSFVCHGDLTP